MKHKPTSEIRNLIVEEVKKILSEIYDTRVDLEWEDSLGGMETEFPGPDETTYAIKTASVSETGDEEELAEYMEKAFPDTSLGFWDFVDMLKSGNIVEVSFRNEDARRGSPRGWAGHQKAFGISNEQGLGAAQIFGIVINGIVELADKENIKGFVFSAQEPSRAKLYRQLASVIGRKEGFEYGVAKSTYDETYYFLLKPELLKRDSSGK